MDSDELALGGPEVTGLYAPPSGQVHT